MLKIVLLFILSISLVSCGTSFFEPMVIYKPEYGDVNSSEEMLERRRELYKVVEEADLELMYNSDDTYFVIKSSSSSVTYLKSTEELEHLANNHDPKGFVVMTIGKNVWTEKELSSRIDKVFQLFKSAGYRRIWIDQAGGGLSWGVYVDKVFRN
jgi:hypothetical protein